MADSPPQHFVRAWREALDLTQEQLGIASGTTKTQVSRLESGERRMTLDWVRRLANGMKVNRDDLLKPPPPEVKRLREPQLPAEPPAGAAVAPMPDLANMPHDLPILGVTRGGREGEGDFRFNGDHAGVVARPPGLRGISDAFCLFVQGESMFPWRNEGERVYIHPSRPARPGDYVVVELKPEHDGEPGGAYLKRLVARSSDGSLVLLQYNPSGKLKVSGAHVKRVFRVMEWEELLMG